ncbi:hypothetical protein [Streptomyces sp. BE303]|uniref:hypothetical protein n=1 Tax=Streptomyces sp. BE303 TaxID=3002528 RepID=UPI002E79D65C|nr:hypothetical protein [Streptomyces sp. BE303]MED7950427.1 hypothetical protein [Streptomyces sp. BE303]
METEEIETVEGFVERVAAIDVAKAAGMVCMRFPHPARDGRRVQEVWNVAAATSAVLELGDRLLCPGVTRVVMEATGLVLEGVLLPPGGPGPGVLAGQRP